MSATSEPVGTLETALAHTQRLMTSEPRLAAEQATEILKVAPGHPLATLLLGVAHRRAGDAAASQAVLEPSRAIAAELGRRALRARPDARRPPQWRRRGRSFATCGEPQARDAGRLARARRSPHCDRRRDGCRRRLRSSHQILDARPAAARSRRGAMRKPDCGRRVVAARASEAASDRRARDAHAGRSRGAAQSLSRCGSAAGTRAGAGAQLPAGASQLRGDSAPATQDCRRRGHRCSSWSRPIRSIRAIAR